MQQHNASKSALRQGSRTARHTGWRCTATADSVPGPCWRACAHSCSASSCVRSHTRGRSCAAFSSGVMTATGSSSALRFDALVPLPIFFPFFATLRPGCSAGRASEGPGGCPDGPGGSPVGPGGSPEGPGGSPEGPGGSWHRAASGIEPEGPGGSPEVQTGSSEWWMTFHLYCTDSSSGLDTFPLP